MMFTFQIRVASCALGSSDLSLLKAVKFILEIKEKNNRGNIVNFPTFTVFLPLRLQTLLAGCVFWFLNPSDRECLHP